MRRKPIAVILAAALVIAGAPARQARTRDAAARVSGAVADAGFVALLPSGEGRPVLHPDRPAGAWPGKHPPPWAMPGAVDDGAPVAAPAPDGAPTRSPAAPPARSPRAPRAPPARSV